MYDPHENPIKEAWVLCVVLGLIMINFPFIHIFNNSRPVFGIPGLVLYFFIGWPLSIVVIWFFVHHIGKKPRSQEDDSDDDGEEL